MVSGANVAVDEAATRVAERIGASRAGTVLHVGNPKDIRLDGRLLTSRAQARHVETGLADREGQLLEARRVAVFLW